MTILITELCLIVSIEFHINDSASGITVEGLILQVFGKIKRKNETSKNTFPAWVKKIETYIHDQCTESLSLQTLSYESG